MNVFGISRTDIKNAIARSPSVEPVLRKLAGKAARGVALPSQFTERSIDYAGQRELEGLFGTIGRRLPEGGALLVLPEWLREPSAWREAVAHFGLGRGNVAMRGKDVFARLKLLVPEAEEALDLLAERDEVSRFVADGENAKDWMRLFRHVVEKRLLVSESRAVTLSQLGSNCLNDSKKLRSGALRRQLAQILGVFCDMDPSDEKALFARFGIIDNPYTSAVTLFAPVSFVNAAGTVFDFPYRLFREGLACQLPLETINTIARLEWCGKSKPLVTTSENAAPFAGMVGRKIPCVYTEGYPNYCVRVLLFALSEIGVECVHEGDADLDGFNIAHEVALTIPTKRIVAADALAIAEKLDPPVGIPLTEAQRLRAESFLDCNPHCLFADEIQRMLDWGRWIEQESFPAILEGKETSR